MGAFWLGVTQFGVFYHPLHDYFHVHTEIIVCLFLAFYALVFITADRNNKNPLARLGTGGFILTVIQEPLRPRIRFSSYNF